MGKAEFKAAFAAAEAGEHASLAPVNNDIQAAQIGASYLDDTEDVAAAKAAFQAAFDDAAAVYHAGYPLTALNAVPFGVHGLGYAGLHYPYAGLHLAGYPVVAAAAPEE